MTPDFLDALRPLFDCLTDGICIADAEGRMLRFVVVEDDAPTGGAS